MSCFVKNRVTKTKYQIIYTPLDKHFSATVKCLEHGTETNAILKSIALGKLSHPWEWCSACSTRVLADANPRALPTFNPCAGNVSSRE